MLPNLSLGWLCKVEKGYFFVGKSKRDLKQWMFETYEW